MVRYIITAALVVTVLGVSACGTSSETTTVIEKAATPPSNPATTTEPVSEEWPQSAQNAFIKGCGETARCYCALDELMAKISADEMLASRNPTAEFRSYMLQAVKDCL